jgi:hypothetical protein
MVALGFAMSVPTLAFAQNQGQGNRGGGNGAADFRQRMMDELKKQLGAKDDEWTAMQPLVEKVFAAQMASATRGFGRGRGGPGGGGGRGQGGGSDTQASSPVQTAARDLTTALEKQDTPPDQIQAKLVALRAAKAKAKTELEAAQKALQEVLQPRQEAVLVSMGMLD